VKTGKEEDNQQETSQKGAPSLNRPDLNPPPSRNQRLQEFLSHPERSLIRLSIPITIGMGIHILYSLVDMIFVGRLGGAAIAAVTYAGSFFFFMFSLSSISVGAQALIAQRIGADDPDGAGQAASHAILLGIVLGVAFFLAGRPLSENVLALVGARDEALTLGTAYLQTIFLGAPFLFFSAFSRAILIGQGDARTPVVILTAATLLNIALDPLLIFTLGWGVVGAARATLAAICASFLAYAFFLFVRRTSHVTLRLRGFRPSGDILWKILKVGVPACLVQLVMSVGGMFFHRILSLFGSDAVAGYGLGGRVDMLIVLPFIGISTALLSLVGMYHGARRNDLVSRISAYTMKWTILAAVVIGCLVFLFAGPLVSVFTDEAPVIAVGSHYLRFIVFVYPMIAFGMNTGRILQGLGLGLPSLVITSTRVLLVGVPLSYLFTRVWGLGIPSVWVAILISGCVSTLISYIWLRRSLKAPLFL